MQHYEPNLGWFFERAANSGGLICYGVGERFQRFRKYFSETIAGEKLLYCVDNDPKKQGTWVPFAGRQVEIRPVEALAECKGKDMILIITNYRYDEIELFLQKKGLLENFEHYSLWYILGQLLDGKALQKKVPENLHILSEPVIPKVIHYCWFGRNPIPDRCKKWMDSWRKFCPDYEIREWNEDNYDVTQNAYMYEAYQKGKWAFVSDYARIDVVYKYGGIYLDTDVELVGSLDDLLYQPAFMGFSIDEAVNLGAGFGSVKGLSEIRALRDYYDFLHFVNPDGSLNLTPCPYLQTEVLKKLGLKLNGEYQRVGNITIYPEKLLGGKNLTSMRILLSPYTKAIHHYEASWLEEDERTFYRRIGTENSQEGILPHDFRWNGEDE